MLRWHGLRGAAPPSTGLRAGSETPLATYSSTDSRRGRGWLQWLYTPAEIRSPRRGQKDARSPLRTSYKSFKALDGIISLSV